MRLVAAAAFVVMGIQTASAQTFCRADRIHVCDGCSSSHNWVVVKSTVPRPQIPGGNTPPNFCRLVFGGLGAMYKPIQIVQKPSLGEAAPSRRHGVDYRSKIAGTDVVTFVLSWIHPTTGRPASGTVTMNIRVVDAPF
jgi:hypothetical protein